MTCYKDKTYCQYWPLCAKGERCDRAYTDKVSEAAQKAGLPVCGFADMPSCFVAWFESKKE